MVSIDFGAPGGDEGVALERMFAQIDRLLPCRVAPVVDHDRDLMYARAARQLEYALAALDAVVPAAPDPASAQIAAAFAVPVCGEVARHEALMPYRLRGG